MLQNLGKSSQLQLNSVKHRLLFISPEVEKGLHPEAKTKDFSIKAGLGQGAFGRVFKVERRSDKKVFAIKQIPKNLVKQQDMVKQIVNEVQIMYKLKHPNIIELFDHFEEEEFIYLLIEYAGGGQLWHKLNEVRRFDERTVQKFMKDIITAVDFCHSRNPPIIHRDIKPENLLLDMQGNVKLADFGWSNFFNNSKRQTYGGTLDYLAPEMIAETGHDLMLDVWSLGVLIFEFLTGQAPFTPTQKIDDPKESQMVLEKNIMNLNIKFPNDFPLLAKDLVLKVLKKDPKQRLPIAEMKKHPWLKEFFQPEVKVQKPINTSSTNANVVQQSTNQSKVQDYKKKIEQQQQQLQQSQQKNNLGQSGLKNQESPTNKAKQELEQKLQQRQKQIQEQEQQQQKQKSQQEQKIIANEIQQQPQINLIDSDEEEEDINVSQPLDPSQQLVNPEQLISKPPPPPEPIKQISVQPTLKPQQPQITQQISNQTNNDDSQQMKPIEVRRIRLLEHQNQMFQQEQDKMWENLRTAEDQLQKQKFEIESKQRIIDELSQIKTEKQQLQEKLKNYQDSHQQQIGQLQSQIEELKLKHDLQQKKQELTNQANPSTKSNGIKNFNEIIPLISTMSENLQKVLGSAQQNHNLQTTLIEYEKELASLKSQRESEFQNCKIELSDKFDDEIESLQTKYHTESAQLQEEKCQLQLQLENDVSRLSNQVTQLELENNKNKMLEKQLEMERQINHESKSEWKNLQISKDMLEKDNKELKNKLMDLEEIVKNLKKQIAEIKKKK